jgi:hypothetical protein
MRTIAKFVVALAVLGAALSGPAQAGCSIAYNPKGKVCTYTSVFSNLHATKYR